MRAPSFQFYHKDWLSDPAVQGMTFDEQGRYLRLLCMTLQTDTPGVMTEDEVRRLCCYSSEEWPGHRDAISAAFKVGRDGNWVQKRTVQDAKARRNRHVQAKNGAAATNVARWSSVAQRQHGVPETVAEPVANRSLNTSHSDNETHRIAVAPSSSSAVEESKDQTKTSLGVETGSGAEPGVANGGPAPDPPPVGRSFASHLSEPTEHPRSQAEIDRDAAEFERARSKAVGGAA